MIKKRRKDVTGKTKTNPEHISEILKRVMKELQKKKPDDPMQDKKR